MHAAVELTETELPFDPMLFGVIAAVLFTILLFVLWSFRNVANRHGAPTDPDAAKYAGGPGASTYGGHKRHD